MRILGLVGSRRKGGNTEILVKEALRGAQAEGAEIDIIRLHDLYIQECNGCMACMLKDTPCMLTDDMNWFWDQLRSCDGVIVGAPSYHGWIPGIFGLLQFRGGVIKPREHFGPECGPAGKAITLCAAGSAFIAGNAIPALNYFAHRMGFQPLGSVLAGSQGPGEVLLSERRPIMEETHQRGRDLALATRGETDRLSDGLGKLRVYDWGVHGLGAGKLYTVEDCCPYCYSQVVANYSWYHTNPLQPGEVECGICHYSRGKPTLGEDGAVRFNLQMKPDEVLYKDWHWRNFVFHKESGRLYQERRRDVFAARKDYAEFKPWLAPPWREPNRSSSKPMIPSGLDE